MPERKKVYSIFFRSLLEKRWKKNGLILTGCRKSGCVPVNRCSFVMPGGNAGCHIVTAEEVNETLQYAANYSLYAYEQEMKQGYLTIEGGHRVGMAGQVIIEGGRVRNLRHVSSVNIRIAHEIKGCGNETLPWLYSDGRLLSTLVIAPSGCG